MSNFKFTACQENTMNIFGDFLAAEHEKYMIIQGASGSGKSTLIRHLVKAAVGFCEMRNLLLLQTETGEVPIYTTKLCATTNPAAAVLQKLCQMPACTIHSLLGIHIINNFNTGNKNMALKRDAQVQYHSLIIVDEGSMINDELMAIMDKQIDSSCKVVIVGDEYQLAPVNQNKTIMEDRPQWRRAEMNKVMRNSGVIQHTGAEFRNTVVKLRVLEDMALNPRDIPDGLFTKAVIDKFHALSERTPNSVNKWIMKELVKRYKPFPIIPENDPALVRVDGPTFQGLVDAKFGRKDYEPLDARILAWTNNKVIEYNNYLRELKGLPPELTMGEVVITNKPIMGSIHAPVDAFVEITGVGMEYTDEDSGIKGRMIEVEGKHIGFLPDNQTQVKSYLARLKKAKNFEQLFHVIDNWLDLRMSYSSTVHKAQGSTYDEVFIDLGDIGKCQSPSDVARMLYVAITRARNKVILYGRLPDYYCG